MTARIIALNRQPRLSKDAAEAVTMAGYHFEMARRRLETVGILSAGQAVRPAAALDLAAGAAEHADAGFRLVLKAIGKPPPMLAAFVEARGLEGKDDD